VFGVYKKVTGKGGEGRSREGGGGENKARSKGIDRPKKIKKRQITKKRLRSSESIVLKKEIGGKKRGPTTLKEAEKKKRVGKISKKEGTLKDRKTR